MTSPYDVVQQLTTEQLSRQQVLRALSDFAHDFGWMPSERIAGYGPMRDMVSGHLLVEHGLEKTAAITFLRSPASFAALTMAQQAQLLSVSYNNLVDWHLHVERDQVSFVYNRKYPPTPVEATPIVRADWSVLRSDALEGVLAKAPKPNTPGLEEAMLETIVYWRRRLAAELESEVPASRLSVLLNALLLLRAFEDYRAFYGETEGEHERRLVDLWDGGAHQGRLRLGRFVSEAAKALDLMDIPRHLLNPRDLSWFDALSADAFRSLLVDLYSARNTPYRYDFSLMSKHALSRIYEHYVTYLRLPPEAEVHVPLFPRFRLPEEARKEGMGAIYTPHFVARFFVRFLRENTTPQRLRNLKAMDPACGSGIFLRTLLEEQCDLSREWVTSDFISQAYANTVGVDVDPNACQATELSLSLLHLSLTGRFPEALHVTASDAFQFCRQHPEVLGSLDAVLANPPFVDLDQQPTHLRSRVREFMGDLGVGRTDLSQAFLYLAAQLVADGGVILFVMPRSFLISHAARSLRNWIAERFDVLFLVDISALEVFPGSSPYPVLLALRRRGPEQGEQRPRAIVAKCQALVSETLDAVLQRSLGESPYSSIYEASQEAFEQPSWTPLPPGEASLAAKLRRFRALGEFVRVREGFVSGADTVFIVPSDRVPAREKAVYIPCLRDKEMQAYRVPDLASQWFFYPFRSGAPLTADELAASFPRTWQHLTRNRERLESRLPVRKGSLEWWRPTRPRNPKNMLRPKIVTPHLVLIPKYALDADGKYGVSHGPFLYPLAEAYETELLRFFVAVLNSSTCHWHVMRTSHTYGQGYAMLEPRTLSPTPVPDPADVADGLMLRVVGLVERRLVVEEAAEQREIERELDSLVASMYGLSRTERAAIGM